MALGVGDPLCVPVLYYILWGQSQNILKFPFWSEITEIRSFLLLNDLSFSETHKVENVTSVGIKGFLK